MPKTAWNPNEHMANCGFCTISWSLQQVTGKLVTADQLYDDTLRYYGINKVPGIDPVPRQLLFSDFDPKTGTTIDQMPTPVLYQALDGKRHGLLDYTIRAVAGRSGLKIVDGQPLMVDALVKFAPQARSGWNLNDFIAARMHRPLGRGQREPILADMQRNVRQALVGVSIIGSIERQHFISMSIDSFGHCKIIDPQDGALYDGMRFHHAFQKIDLHLRVEQQ